MRVLILTLFAAVTCSACADVSATGPDTIGGGSTTVVTTPAPTHQPTPSPDNPPPGDPETTPTPDPTPTPTPPPPAKKKQPLTCAEREAEVGALVKAGKATPPQVVTLSDGLRVYLQPGSGFPNGYWIVSYDPNPNCRQ